MKHIFFLVFIPQLVFCQASDTIELAFNKTSHLFFSSNIKYVDTGTQDVIKESNNNILKIAAAIRDFEETNLTVVTSDNVVYSFILRYNEDVKTLTYFFNDRQGMKIETDTSDSSETVNDEKNVLYKRNCAKIKDSGEELSRQGAYNKKISLSLTNVFIIDDRLYFKLILSNSSSIDYDVELLEFRLVNKKRMKKSPIQEDILTPLFVYNPLKEIKSNSQKTYSVFVFDKFTVPKEKKLVIEMIEKRGGRHIKFSVDPDVIITAQKL